MSTKEIVVLKGQSQYDVLRYMADIICDEWTKNGYHVNVIDFTKRDSFSFDEFKNARFAFSYQALFFEVEDAKNIDIPYIGTIADHPIYHRNRVLGARNNRNLHIVCLDQNHKEYVDKMFDLSMQTHFLGWTGYEANRSVEYEQKDIDVFCPVTFISLQKAKEQIDELPEVFRNTCYEAIDIIKQDGDISPVRAVLDYFDRIGFSYNREEIDSLNPIFMYVDSYIRAYCRESLVRELTNSGVKVTVLGKSGWEQFECECPENILTLCEEGMNMKDTIEYIARSKMCLSPMPVHTRGVSERFLTAMVNKAVCVDSYSSYRNALFPEDEVILFYHMGNEKEIVEKVKNVLDDTSLAKEMTEKAYKLAKEKYTIRQYAHKILNLVENIEAQ